MATTPWFNYDESQQTIQFCFYSFTDSLRYDPDITIIDYMQTAISSSPPNETNLILGLSVGIVVGLILLVVTILAIVFFLKRKRRIREQEKTWKGITYDEELGERTESHKTSNDEAKLGQVTPAHSERGTARRDDHSVSKSENEGSESYPRGASSSEGTGDQ